MPSESRFTWEPVPPHDDPTIPSKTEIATALKTRPGHSLIVARHDRAARAAAQAQRINEGRDFGPGFTAVARQIGSEHRVYAWANPA